MLTIKKIFIKVSNNKR